MLDLLIEGATVIDGTGEAPRTADVGIADGRIREVGRITRPAREHITAHGAWLTPGFVDLHTHYDGQASWDETFNPSIHHGVTTVVFGNCGVGFAPLAPGDKQHAIDGLISLMEGVEDIPGVALAEGVSFDWQSFPEYMSALERMPHSLDFLVQVPHDPLRMAVMGDRALAQQAANETDIADMRRLLREALEAGAAGFSTGRTDNHRTTAGLATPASEAAAAELAGIAQAFKGLDHGVVQVVSDFNLLQGPTGFDAEFDLVELLAKESGKTLSMTWLQRDPGGEQWRAIRARTEAAVASGLPLWLQASPRGIGVILGLDTTFHPLMGFPAYIEVAALRLAERAAALRDPARKARLLAEKSGRLAGDGSAIPPLVDLMLARIEMISGRMFPLVVKDSHGQSHVDYEPPVTRSLLAQARQRGCSALEAIYDFLAEGDGSNLIHFPIFNYNEGSLATAREMLDHPRALYGLSDSGAHVGTICDASSSTFMLSHWARDRSEGRLAPERVIEMLSRRNARHIGLHDRGEIAPGMRADFNLIDPLRVAPAVPHLVRDLPAGGKRLLQTSHGYLGTWVAGTAVVRDGHITRERPGHLVRLGRNPSRSQQ
ncbi:MAG: D-aminoacylase [Gammaproteobacteria bacterium]|jgi:N-acyl-D-aspartate/D-glutamate deacylase|nr:D-aminoacylase [Gammaproteobacteria bacterium]